MYVYLYLDSVHICISFFWTNPRGYYLTHNLTTLWVDRYQTLRQHSRAKAVLRILMSADQGVTGKQPFTIPSPFLEYKWDINGIL